MKKTLPGLFILFILFSLTTRAQQPKTPIELNNYMSGIVATLYQKGSAWGTKFVEVKESKNYSELTPLRKDIEKVIAAKQAELRTIDNIGGSEDFKNALMVFLKYENTLLQTFIPFENLTKDSKQEDIDALYKNLTDQASKENEVLGNIRKIQMLYAKRNNFSIETKKD